MKESEITLHEHIKDPDRLEALNLTGLLDSPTEEAFDRLTRLATRFTNSPIALVSLVDSDRQFFKSCIGLPEPWKTLRQTPLSHSFCKHNRISGQPLIIKDARKDIQFKDNLAVKDLDVVAYLGFPLVILGSYVIGSFCVIDSKPRSWTKIEIDTIKDLTDAVMDEIDLRLEISQRIKAENLFKLAIENSPVGIIVSSGKDEKVIAINKKFTELFGYSQKEIPNVSAWWPIAYPDKSYREEISKKWTGELKRALTENSEVAPIEVRIKCKNGSDKEVSVQASSYNDTNFVVFFDLTKRKAVEREREKLISELKQLLDEVRTLKGIIPICSSCKKIRDDKGYWNQIESYIQNNSEAKFSHSMCPECSDNFYGQEDWYIEMKREEADS